MQYEWGSSAYVDGILQQFPVDVWPTIMQEWWSWAIHFTDGLYQPLIQSVILCSGIYAESHGDRYRRSGYVNSEGVREDSVGLFQLYRFGVGAPFVPELNGGIDRREDPMVQFSAMVPRYNSAFITAWNQGLRGERLCQQVCGNAEGSAAQYWGGYASAWRQLTADLPWKDYLAEGFE